MDKTKFINWGQSYLDSLKSLFDLLDLKAIEKASELIWNAYQMDKFIFVVGNGGSASTASHMACDFQKTILGHQGDAGWKAFKMLSLTDNNSLITAWSNDTSYEVAYAEQLKNLGSKGDLLIAISSSGNSQNILNCVETANKIGMLTIGISGFGGGKLASKVEVALVVDSKDYGPVEDIQLVLNHMLVFYFYNKLQTERTAKLNSKHKYGRSKESTVSR